MGYYDGGPGNAGFLLSGGNYKTLLFGSQSTVAAGISNNGTVVGYYANQGAGPSNLGFSWTRSSGFNTLNIPGTNGTVPFAVNDSDQIAGFFLDGRGDAHGFLLTPTPAPSSLILAGFGLLSLLAFAWHAHRKTHHLELPGICRERW